jgi:tape measure domain-containing protein
MATVGYATLQIIPVAKGFSAAINGQIAAPVAAASASAGRTAGSALGGSMVRSFAALGVGAGIFAALKTGISQAASQEQALIGFEQLLGSRSAAEAYFSKIRDYAKKTPFEIPGLVDANRRLLGVGFSAEESFRAVDALGEASAALGLTQDQMGRAILAVSQIQTKGKVRAQELLQLTEAGIPIYRLLQQTTGKTGEELEKMGEKGQLLAKDVLPALFTQLKRNYSGSLERQSQTLAGVWSNFKDTVSQALVEGVQPLVPLFQRILPAAANTLSNAVLGISGALQGLFERLSTIKPETVEFGLKVAGAVLLAFPMISVLQRIGKMAAFAGGQLKTAAKHTLDYGKTFLGPTGAMAQFRQGTKLTAASTSAMAPAMTNLGAIMAGLLTGNLKAVRAGFVALIAPMKASLGAFLVGTAPILAIAAAIAAFVGVLVMAYKSSAAFRASVAKAFEQVRDAISGAFAKIKKAFEDNREGIGKLQAAFKFLGDFIGAYIVPILSGGLVKAIGVVATAISVLITGISKAISAFSSLFSWVTRLPGVSSAIDKVRAKADGVTAQAQAKAQEALNKETNDLAGQRYQAMADAIKKENELKKKAEPFKFSSPVDESAAKKAAREYASNVKSLGDSLGLSFDKAIRGSTSQAESALDRVLTNARKLNNSKITAMVSDARSRILALAATRDGISERLDKAQSDLKQKISDQESFRKRLNDQINSEGNVSDMGRSFGSIIRNLTRAVSRTESFGSALERLKAAGLNDSSLQQIVEAGPKAGLKVAEAILAGGTDGIAALNVLQSQLQTQADSIAKSMGEKFYAAGIQSAKGIVAGIEAEIKSVESAMSRLANAMVTAIKTALKIKSPSRVFMAIGDDISAGLLMGVESGSGNVTKAVLAMTNASADSASTTNAALGSASGSTVIVNNFNPISEPSSVTVSKTLSRLAFLEV